MQQHNRPAVSSLSVLFWFVFLQQASTCPDWFWTKTNACSQLKRGRGLWHGVVDKGVAERHKLVSDDFNGLLCRRTWKVKGGKVEEFNLWAQRKNLRQMRNSCFWNNVTAVTSQKCGNCVRLSCTVSTAAEDELDRNECKNARLHSWREFCALSRLTTHGCSRLWCWR